MIILVSSSGSSSSWNKLLGIQQQNFRFHRREETWVTEQLRASPEHCSIMLMFHCILLLAHSSHVWWPGYLTTTVTRLCVGQSRVEFPAQQQCPHWLLGPPSLLLNEHQGFYPRGEADHSLAHSAEGKNLCSCTSAPPYAFVAQTEASLPFYHVSIYKQAVMYLWVPLIQRLDGNKLQLPIRAMHYSIVFAACNQHHSIIQIPFAISVSNWGNLTSFLFRNKRIAFIKLVPRFTLPTSQENKTDHSKWAIMYMWQRLNAYARDGDHTHMSGL